MYQRFTPGALRAYHQALQAKVRADNAVALESTKGERVKSGLTADDLTISDLIAIYCASQAFSGLRPNTKVSYASYFRRIEAKFGGVLVKALEQRGWRTVFRQWRDEELSAHPRTADAIIGTFRRVLNFGVSEEHIVRNPLAFMDRLCTSTRRDIIWSETQINAFLDSAPRHLARVMLIALWTGQRQADILTLEWSGYDGTYIRLQQRKHTKNFAGRRIKVLVSRELQAVLAEIKAEQLERSLHPNIGKRVPLPPTILTTRAGFPWRRGFKCAWRQAVDKAGISGVTFHDLRGTFITLSHRAGATIREIAEASGHDEKDCERIIRHHYLASGAELVIERLQANTQFASLRWQSAAKPVEEPMRERHTGPRRPRLLTAT